MNIQTVKQQENGYLVNGSVSVPNDPNNRHYKMIQEWIAEGNTPEPEDRPDPIKLRKAACDQIDLAADAARRRFVSPGDLIEKEYEVALQQAKDWLAAGMPDPVPSAVLSGIAASNNTLTTEQAARQIVDMAAALELVLMTTREIRLTGKAAVNAAADDADFDAVAKPYLDQLEAIKPEVV